MKALLLAALLGFSALAWATPGPAHPLTGQVNLNEASLSELDQLPGVGMKAAAKIQAYRDKKRFARVEELVRVKGFGKKRFLKLRPYLSVEGATTLKRARP